ncbi:MAG: NAD-dependent epimerase [Spirochaetota bacterium]
MEHVLVTGAAGFIGFHLARRLLERGTRVTGLDNLNDYYEVSLKHDRLGLLEEAGRACGGKDGGRNDGGGRKEDGGGRKEDGGGPPRFRFVRADLADRRAVQWLFREEGAGGVRSGEGVCGGGGFDAVAHLAAQAGVRHSLRDPYAYVHSNLEGLVVLLEACRARPPRHLVFASTSSVYGANTAMPYSVHHNADHPLSLYGATKKAGEMIAHTYAHLHGLPVTCLRFFTVYGPWGRPDMAYFSFTRDILAGRPITVYNRGDMKRDFTYIDDIVEGVCRVLERPPAPDPGWDRTRPDPAGSFAPYRVYNIGRGEPVGLDEFIGLLERALGRKAERRPAPMPPGDVPATWADVSDLARDTGFSPRTGLAEGINRFVDWYRSYYSVG